MNEYAVAVFYEDTASATTKFYIKFSIPDPRYTGGRGKKKKKGLLREAFFYSAV
jgi:hypothetical protein